MPTSNSCKNSVGRLLEIRARSYRDVAEVDQMIQWIREGVSRVPGKHVLIVADWRILTLFSPTVADKVAEMLTRANPLVIRSAVLAATLQPTHILQVTRIVREVKNPDRKVFTDPDELVRWMAEVAEPAELARIRQFVHSDDG